MKKYYPCNIECKDCDKSDCICKSQFLASNNKVLDSRKSNGLNIIYINKDFATPKKVRV